MFERTSQDLIRGSRAHKASSRAQEEAFLNEAMGEIREELKGKDMASKAEAILKMCYLMMSYPIAPPTGFAFHVVETMSSPRYHSKQSGYTAAPMAFTGDSEEVVSTINSIKKDSLSPHLAIPPLPLSALPHMSSSSPSSAQTSQPESSILLTHSSPRIRKRAVLCSSPCWESYPEGLREGFPRLRERLLDEDQSVVGATVGVVMELARKQGGKNYLPLAPESFSILTNSSNNWMSIKVVKSFAISTPLEPRLVRKLLPPLTSLISSTSAISLLYECVRTCIVGGMSDPDRPEGDASARVCVDKSGSYLRDEGGDQNLRYIALLAMVKITPTHPHMVAEYQDEISESSDDADSSIRMRALESVTAMVDRDNLQHIADQSSAHLAPEESANSPSPSAAAQLAAIAGRSTDAAATAKDVSSSPAYRSLLTQRLLDIISHDVYSNVTDFEWVVSVSVDVAYVSHVNVGERIRETLLDVVGRVKSVRAYAVSVLEKVVADDDFRERAQENTGEDGLSEAAVWICGEYSSNLTSPLSTIHNLLPPSLVHSSPQLIASSIHAAAKVFGHYAAQVSNSWNAEAHQELKNLVASITAGLEPFVTSPHIEVQERAVEITQLSGFVNADLQSHVPPKHVAESIPGMEGGFEAEAKSGADPSYPKSSYLSEPSFSAHESNSVGYRAQEAVRIPDGSNLDLTIVPNSGFSDEKEDELDTDSEPEEAIDLGHGGGAGMDELRRVLREQDRSRKGKKKGKKEDETQEERVERLRRKAARREKHKNDPYYLYDDKAGDDDDIDDIPIVKSDDEDLEASASPAPQEKPKKKKTKAAAPPVFDRGGEMPEGAAPLPDVEKVRTGSAAVDSSDVASGSHTPVSRYEEYTLDDEGPGTPATPATPADVPAEETQAVKVTKVRKKKKDGVKKKKKVEVV